MTSDDRFEDRLLRELHQQLAEQPVRAVAHPAHRPARRRTRRWAIAGGLSAAAATAAAALPLLVQPGAAYAISQQADGSFIVVLHDATEQDIERAEREMKARGIRVELVAGARHCGAVIRDPDPDVIRKTAPPSATPSMPPSATPSIPPSATPSIPPSATPSIPPSDPPPAAEPPGAPPGPNDIPKATEVRSDDPFGVHPAPDRDDVAFKVNPAAFPAGQVLWIAVSGLGNDPSTGRVHSLAFDFVDVGKPAPTYC